MDIDGTKKNFIEARKRTTRKIEKEREQKLMSLEPWHIEQLRYKSMILLNSLLEMRDIRKSDVIIKRIIRAIHVEDLERLMTQVYRAHKKLYPSKELRMESFGHVNFFFGYSNKIELNLNKI